MDYTNLVQVISSVGFPIVACCALFWNSNKTISLMTEAINNNTTAIRELRDRIENM